MDVTKEWIKTKRSSVGTRRENKRMQIDRMLTDLQSNVLTVIEEEPSTPKPVGLGETVELASKVQTVNPRVTSFPFGETTRDRERERDRGHEINISDKALPVVENAGQSHGVKLCMVSAVVHMKGHEARRAKSITELKKRPVTSLKEYDRSKRNEHRTAEDKPEVQMPGSCRYLRCHQEKELTIEEIFG
ncbi:hypothetical protein DPMN_080920 [Dreissena polymorpha]|uniref:Uncharacterized protein n=1 Tax=Dreissena polymorpha TaxID=45954 RepID=A0A9D4BFT7_DREPO|nr:hypothetical protein DPMN_080920 [Dreissena polymorpha]